jgi:poly-gamma-glutamate synthesis protein (capsule biosynthesis protein)
MSTSFKKQFIWSFGFFILIFLSLNIFFNLSSKLINKNAVSNAGGALRVVSPSPIETKNNLRLAFVGDIMLDRGVKYFVNRDFGGDYNELFVKVGPQLQGYDLLFGNLEGSISDKGIDEGGLYSFRFDPKVLPVLKKAGFDIFSVANNHSFNWGEAAFADNLRLLSGAGMNYVGGGLSGTEAYQEKVINIDGIKIAFLAFSDFKAGGLISTSTRPGMAVISEEAVQKGIAHARLTADLVVVSYHFGEEYQVEPNSYQRKYANLGIDAGADLIVGHHPHVVQTLEQYKGKYIIYSLGNFIFDQYFSPETMQGGLLEVEVNPNTKLIEKAILKKVQLNNLYQIESIE